MMGMLNTLHRVTNKAILDTAVCDTTLSMEITRAIQSIILHPYLSVPKAANGIPKAL